MSVLKIIFKIYVMLDVVNSKILIKPSLQTKMLMNININD